MRITTFTADAFEGQFALRLLDSCRAFGIEVDHFGVSGDEGPRHSVRLRCLLRSLRAGKADALYVDPDAQLLRRPEIALEEKDFDVGVYYDSKTLELSGPLFLRNTPRIAPLLREWGAVNKAYPDNSEMANLSRALAEPGHSLTVRRLPVTYAWVERLHRTTYPQAQPVIVHFKGDGLETLPFQRPKTGRF
ncbi:MAG TPA: hypothetical protein VE981_15375 [Planctomycetota bacterium]|nr:hypothetical protein [Planctomycetota bacterium]